LTLSAELLAVAEADADEAETDADEAETEADEAAAEPEEAAPELVDEAEPDFVDETEPDEAEELEAPNPLAAPRIPFWRPLGLVLEPALLAFDL